MDAYQILLKVTSRKELNSLLNFLRENHFPLDPCCNNPQIREVDKNLAEVAFFVSSKNLEQLEEGGYKYEILKDYSDEVDPREYVSKTNRFKEELEKLKKSR